MASDTVLEVGTLVDLSQFDKFGKVAEQSTLATSTRASFPVKVYMEAKRRKLF
jgi:hypothetical protein